MSTLQIHLDFARMKEENPNLLTLKDFLMSSNQAPETENDIQQLLQAFADFKQGKSSELATLTTGQYNHALQSSFLLVQRPSKLRDFCYPVTCPCVHHSLASDIVLGYQSCRSPQTTKLKEHSRSV